MFPKHFFKIIIKDDLVVKLQDFLDYLEDDLYKPGSAEFNIEFQPTKWRESDHDEYNKVDSLPETHLKIRKIHNHFGPINLYFDFLKTLNGYHFQLVFNKHILDYAKSNNVTVKLSTLNNEINGLCLFIFGNPSFFKLLVEDLCCERLVVQSNFQFIQFSNTQIGNTYLSGTAQKIEVVNSIDTINKNNNFTVSDMTSNCFKFYQTGLNLNFDNCIVGQAFFEYTQKKPNLIIRDTTLSNLSLFKCNYNKVIISSISLATRIKRNSIIDVLIALHKRKLFPLWKVVIDALYYYFKELPRSYQDYYALKIERTKIESLILENLKFNRYNPLFITFDTFKNLYCVNVNFSLDSFVGHGKEDRLILINQFKRYFTEAKNIEYSKYFEALERISLYRNGHRSFPMWLSSITNRFALDLVMPFLWILYFLVLEILVILSASQCEYSIVTNYGVLTGLLNPAVSPKTFIDFLPEVCQTSFYVNTVYLSVNIYRIIYGFLIFQFIRAFRFRYNLQS